MSENCAEVLESDLRQIEAFQKTLIDRDDLPACCIVHLCDLALFHPEKAAPGVIPMLARAARRRLSGQQLSA
jgi:hypothetical protein